MEYKKGRGAQINTRNKFLRNEKTREHVESIDDWTESNAHPIHRTGSKIHCQ